MTTKATNTCVNLSFTPEYEVVASNPTKLTFNAHLAAPEVVDDTAKRASVSITAVIDKSGSMRGTKLELVKKTCNFMLNQLSSNDTMGLVEYDTQVNELIPLSRSSDTFKSEASAVINNMRSGSCTNLSGGLFEGLKQQQGNTYVDWDKPVEQGSVETETSIAPTGSEPSPESPVPMLVEQTAPQSTQGAKGPEGGIMAAAQSLWNGMWSNTAALQAPASQAPVPRHRSKIPRTMHTSAPTRPLFGGRTPGLTAPVEEDAVRSVFLFTDGLANVGITHTRELVEALGQRLDGSPRVRVYTFGFGADHSAELLAELARVGAGTYYFMEKEESIPTAFADALGGLLSVAAQNVSVEFRPASGVTVSSVHTAYQTREGAGGARSVAVGDLFSEEGKDLLFEVELGAWDSSQAAEVSVGTLAVSYLDVQGACLRQAEVQCTVRRAEQVPAGVEANEGVALQKARIETAASMAEARRAAEGGDLEGARAMLQGCLERVQGVRSEGAFKSQLCEDLVEAQTNMVDRRTYAARGSKLMWAKGKAHMEQRSACLSDDEDCCDDDDEAEARATKFSYANVSQKTMRAKARSLMPSK